MKRLLVFATLAVLILTFETNLHGQFLSAGRLGIGLNAGGQKIYGGVPWKTGFGFGTELYAKYTINPRFFAVSSFGYGELSDGTLIFDKCTFSTDVINLDIKAAVNLITEGRIIPYGYLGLGAIWFNHDQGKIGKDVLTGNYFGGYFDASFMLGGGIEARLNPRLALNAYMDYRFTTGDDLDTEAYPGSANDGYLNIRTGMTYYLDPSRFSSGSGIEVAEKAPIDELDGETGDAADGELNALIEGIDSWDEASGSEMAMDEYVQLKSRVDQLNDAIGQRELEIGELKSQLSFRKDRITELETNIQGRGGAVASSLSTDLSDFSSSYQQALQYYNSHELDAAVYLFNSLLETSPTHKLASNCQYWIGECFFVKGDHASAAEAFEKVLAYRQSYKKDDALLMLGRCYVKLGDKQLALQMFNQLMNEYPDSEYCQRAQNYASSI